MAALALAMAVPWLAGCQTVTPQATPEDDLSLRLAMIQTREQGATAFSNPPAFNVHLLDTQAAYAEAWKRHNATTPPTVLFEQRTVLLVELVGTPQSGWTIDVDNATFEGGLYHVHVVTTEPGVNCVEQGQPSQTYYFAAFDRKLDQASDAKLLADRTHIVRGCL